MRFKWLEPYVSARTCFPTLDGLRAVAVLSVMFHHMYTFFNWWPLKFSHPFVSRMFEQLSALGYLGVDIFFVISGFLIAGLLLEDFPEKIRIKRFYIRRAFKILPQYLAVVLIGETAAFLLREDASPATYWGYFLMYQNYVMPISTLSHLWSIAVEEHFYLIFPVILQMICMFVLKVEKRGRALLGTLFTLLVLGNWMRYSAFQGLGPEAINDFWRWEYTHCHADGLVFGALLRFAFPWIVQQSSKRPNLPVFFFMASAVLFVIIFNFYDRLCWWHYTMVYVASGFLMLSGLLGCRPLMCILENKLLKYIGKCSYGIYLWHYMLLFLFGHIYMALGLKHMLPLYIPLALAAGIASTVLIEKRFLNVRARLAP